MNKIIILTAIFLAGNIVNAEEKAPKQTKYHGMGMGAELSKEERAKFAERHDKIAACLRSDKPMADCHKEMREGMGQKGCPGWGKE